MNENDLLKIKNDYNWKIVFTDNPSLLTDISKIHYIWSESPDGLASWEGFLVAETPEVFIYASGQCDTTGWDCRGSYEERTFSSLEEALSHMTEEDRRRAGLPSLIHKDNHA